MINSTDTVDFFVDTGDCLEFVSSDRVIFIRLILYIYTVEYTNYTVDFYTVGFIRLIISNIIRLDPKNDTVN